MNLEEIKAKMLAYIDLLGGTFLDTDKIRNATTIEELNEVFDSHDSFISDQCNDAQHSLGRFKRSLGVNDY